jgi:hypothetical protein
MVLITAKGSKTLTPRVEESGSADGKTGNLHGNDLGDTVDVRVGRYDITVTPQ